MYDLGHRFLFFFQMGAKMKQRDAVNQKASQATLSVNERILKECHQLYTDVENGLVEVMFVIFLRDVTEIN
jgi:hypothetical protein